MVEKMHQFCNPTSIPSSVFQLLIPLPYSYNFYYVKIFRPFFYSKKLLILNELPYQPDDIDPSLCSFKLFSSRNEFKRIWNFNLVFILCDSNRVFTHNMGIWGFLNEIYSQPLTNFGKKLFLTSKTIDLGSKKCYSNKKLRTWLPGDIRLSFFIFSFRKLL